MSSVQNRTFLGAIAAAIVSFCKTFIRTMAVAEEGVAMAEKAVKTARKRQSIDLGLDMADYAQQARERVALKQVKQHMATKEYINGDPEKQALMEAARKNLDRIIAQELAELSQKEE